MRLVFLVFSLIPGLAVAAPVPNYCQPSTTTVEQLVTGDSAEQLYNFLKQNNPSAEVDCGHSIRHIAVGNASCFFSAGQTPSPYTCGSAVDAQGNFCAKFFACPY